MVASQEKEVLGELQLVAEQQHDALDRILAPINVVSDEEVVAVPGVASVLEDLQEVGILTVYIA